jgi:hypothetical protein
MFVFQTTGLYNLLTKQIKTTNACLFLGHWLHVGAVVHVSHGPADHVDQKGVLSLRDGVEEDELHGDARHHHPQEYGVVGNGHAGDAALLQEAC